LVAVFIESLVARTAQLGARPCVKLARRTGVVADRDTDV
jgi:hypothetical protein